jgi:8-oxo-dGTP pyrophosphatase MutT (NUDIX family)
MANELPPEGAGILLVWQNQHLFLERNPNYVKNDKKRHELEYPGGKVHPNETYLECAIREVKEETGNVVSVSPDQIVDHVTVTSPAKKGIRLFVANMTQDQYESLSKINQALQDEFTRDPTKAETLSACFVSVDRVKAHVLNDEKLEYPLRSFNKILIKELIQQNKI